MFKHNTNSNYASKVIGGAATVTSIGLLIASFFTAGIVLQSANLVCASTSGTGLIVGCGADIGKRIHESKLLHEAHEVCQRDHQLGLHLEIQGCKNLIECGSATKTGGKMVVKGLEIVTNDSKACKIAPVIEVGGRILNILTLPLDIIDIVETSIKVNKGTTHEASNVFREIATRMEEELLGMDCDV